MRKQVILNTSSSLDKEIIKDSNSQTKIRVNGVNYNYDSENDESVKFINNLATKIITPNSTLNLNSGTTTTVSSDEGGSV